MDLILRKNGQNRPKSANFEAFFTILVGPGPDIYEKYLHAQTHSF
jgi:hypothetical protein